MLLLPVLAPAAALQLHALVRAARGGRRRERTADSESEMCLSPTPLGDPGYGRHMFVKIKVRMKGHSMFAACENECQIL